ncbi:MAG: DUF5682 family protein [Polyangiaceae bacterium]
MSDAALVHLFPVRHHSPRASVVLHAFLEHVQPDKVLIEGPSDAGALIDVLVDAETAPPVAILAYRTDGVPGSTLWPFAAYSPEYVALRWAREHGKEARFVDVSAAQVLARASRQATAEPEGAGDDPLRSPWSVIVDQTDFRSFDELWEARFEAPAHSHAGFREALRELAETVRLHDGSTEETKSRDAVLRAGIERALAEGTPADKIVAVFGAAHVAAIAAGDVDPAKAALHREEVPTSLTVIPYSFPRLAEQLGYGAGNRAPLYYQRAFDAGGDYQRATLEVLVDFTDHLRLRGFSVSLADTIEAYRLACMLSDMRGKSGPGIDEVREATIATLCRGESAHVDGFLWSSVVGKGVGRVARGIGKNSLQTEFWTTVRHYNLPETDETVAVSLKLADTTQLEASTFLHRLRVLDVPYAGLVGARKARGDPEPGGFAALARVRESWQVQWTPSTEVALVERIVLGESFQAAAERALEARLAERKTVGDASEVLVDAVLVAAGGAVAQALAACDALAAHDDDVSSLARACRALGGLASYGSSRKSLGADDRVLVPLLQKTFARATLRLPYAAGCGDGEAPAVTGAMRVLQELAMTQGAVDRDGWVAALEEVARSFSAHPRCAGTAAGLLLVSRLWDDASLARELGLRLSAVSEPAKTADFVAGFLEVNALAMVKDRDVVGILDAYLQSLSDEAFRDAIPALRRALADLGKTERRYLVESVVAVRGHAASGGAAEAARVLTEQDQAQLRAASAEIQQAMDDLDDLL